VKKSISRREVLGNIVCAGAGALLAVGKTSAQSGSLKVADRLVEIGLAQLSPHTICLSIVPTENNQRTSIPDDGSLTSHARRPPSITFSNLAQDRRIPFGDLTVTVSPDPLAVSVFERRRLAQRLVIDKQTGAVSFEISSPVLALGEGGPQFDRRGNKDEMRNGQGGYRLRIILTALQGGVEVRSSRFD
jgi:alpha-glucosidase/alpha-D-xyloside xylohydrolase